MATALHCCDSRRLPRVFFSKVGTAEGNCEKHGRYVAPVIGNRNPVCPECLAERMNLEIREEMKKRRDEAIEISLSNCGIDQRFKQCDFDNYCVDEKYPGQAVAKNICERYAKRFDKVMEDGNALLLLGTPGTGKTHLAVAILRHVIKNGYSGMILGMPSFLRKARENATQVIEACIAPDLLVLDEVGMQFEDSAKDQSLLFSLLDGRYSAIRPTVLVGNCLPRELASFVGERVIDRLRDRGATIVPFEWPSYRKGVFVAWQSDE